MAQAVDNLRKARVEIAKPSGKGALAQAQIGRHDLVACPAGGEQLDDAALQLLQEFGLVPLLPAQHFVAIAAQHLEQPVVGGRNGKGKVAPVKFDRDDAAVEPNRAAKEPP